MVRSKPNEELSFAHENVFVHGAHRPFGVFIATDIRPNLDQSDVVQHLELSGRANP